MSQPSFRFEASPRNIESQTLSENTSTIPAPSQSHTVATRFSEALEPAPSVIPVAAQLPDIAAAETITDSTTPLLNNVADQQAAGKPNPQSRNSSSVLPATTYSQVTTFPELSAQSSEHSVNFPLSKLEALVELCGQILRESRASKRVQNDPERQGTDAPCIPSQDSDARSLDESPRDIFGRVTPFYEPLPEVDAVGSRLIDDIWGNVSPWKHWRQEQVTLASESRLDPSSVMARCRKIDDLPLLFGSQSTGTVGCSEIPDLTSKTLVKVLSWRFLEYEKLVQPSEARFGVLVHCVLAINNFGTRIGRILESCYRARVLTQPSASEPKEYLEHILLVVECSIILNPTLALERPLFGNPYWRLKMTEAISRRNSLDEVLGLKIHDLHHILHALYSKPSFLDSADGTTLRIDDLNVGTLTTIGGLSIKWTEILEDHLRLDLTQRTLYIAWFSCLNPPEPRSSNQSMYKWWSTVVLNLPNTFLEGSMGSPATSPIGSQVQRELLQSWAMLFATDPDPNKRAEEYEKLPKAEWMLEHATKESPTDDISNTNSNLLAEFKNKHLGFDTGRWSTDSTCYGDILSASLTKKSIPYSHFPVFEARLRQLRQYMGNQKPRGFRQLWHDKRDSLNYYTFWGVIIFGGVSVFLAFFSLAVSVAQTIASFRALELSSPSMPAS